MRMTVFIGLVVALLAGCIIASGQTFIGRPMMPLNSAAEFNVFTVLTNAYGGYSFSRRLSPSYSGPAFRANNGSTTQDIGFVNGITDTNALVTFAGANSVYVDILYDQSGRAAHMNNVPALITERIQVATNGTIFLSADGWLRARTTTKPAPSTGRSFLRSTETLNYQQAGYFVVFNQMTFGTGGGGGEYVIASLGGDVNAALRQTDAAGLLYLDCSAFILTAATSLNTDYLVNCDADKSSTDRIQINQTSAVTGNAGAQGGSANGAILGINAGSDLFASVWLYEMIVYTNTLTADARNTIQTNINAFYTLW